MNHVDGGAEAAWQPILEQADADQVQAILESLARALGHTEIAHFYGPSLSRGAAGVALFLAYLAEATTSPSTRGLAEACLQHAVRVASSQRDDPDLALFHGLAGVAWTANHLDGAHSLLEKDLASDLDERLTTLVAARPWRGAYDLVRGLVGLGVFALSRLDDLAGRELLCQIIHRLEEMSQSTNEGATWWTDAELLSPDQRKTDPNGHINLGLAHGIPGIIALLGSACAAGVALETARPLLNQAVRWLLAHRLPDAAPSCFASLIPKGTGSFEPNGSRLAWCYGDLGLAAALYTAAVQVDEHAWMAEAVAIARRASVRTVERSGVKDAGLCHGAAGNAHIFNRFYQATGNRAFLDASRFWFKKTLEFYCPNAGIGGFRAWRRAEPGRSEWWFLPGVLEGSAGIGLALVAASSAIEPQWDQFLMLSPIRGRR